MVEAVWQQKSRKGSQLNEFEWKIINMYLKSRDCSFYQVEFQVRVGKKTEYRYVENKKLRKAIEESYRMKIDCVAKSQNKPVEIIEIKRVAGAGAVGQLLVYSFLYERDWGLDTKMVLVCSQANESIREACEFFGIELWKETVDE